jgi:hypothetical protein
MGILKDPSNAPTLRQEIRTLDYLRGQGIPTIPATTTICAEIPSIHYHGRYELNSKDYNFPGPYAKPSSLTQYYAIANTLIAKCIWISDLQFGIKKNGDIVVVDPVSAMLNSNPIGVLEIAARKLERALNAPRKDFGSKTAAGKSPAGILPPPAL